MIYSEKKVEMLRQRYPEGTRICLDHMEDLCPVESGTCGTVQFVDDAGTLHCKFDDGRMLGVISDVDKFHKIDQEQTQTDEQAEENALNDEITGDECDYYYNNVSTGEYDVEINIDFSGCATFIEGFEPLYVDKNRDFMLQLISNGAAVFDTA